MSRTFTPKSCSFLLLFAVLATACGRSEDGTTLPPSIQGPPRWRILSEESRAGESGFAIQARSACRVRFRLERAGVMPEESTWHTLTTGQTTQVLWDVETNDPTRPDDLPSREDTQAGRTEGTHSLVRFHLAGTPVWQRRFTLWARPGKGRVLSTECMPPGAYEPLDWSQPLEVAAIAMTELASGEARLLPRHPRSRLVLPETSGPDDRHEIVRLLLEVVPLSDE